MMSDTKDRIESVKRLAEFEVSAAVESRGKLIDEHHSAFRWVVASLFALNGGAILSILNKDELGIITILPAFWVFFAGILSTFFTVILAQISDRMMIARLHQWGLYWTSVGSTGVRDEAREVSIEDGISKAESWGQKARIFAAFAMIWFVFGVLTSIVLDQKSRIAEIEAELKSVEAQQVTR